VSRYQKGKTSLDFTEARDSEWQWHQLGHMQVCTSLQTDNYASTPPLSFFTGRMLFLPPNQQRQSTEAIIDIRLGVSSAAPPVGQFECASVSVCHVTLTKLLHCRFLANTTSTIKLEEKHSETLTAH